MIRERKPRLLVLHLLELDSTHHQHGPNTPQGRAVAAVLDGLVGQVVKAVEDAGLRDRTAIFITADHGFIAVTKTLRPNAILRKQGLIKVKDGKITSARVHVVPEGGIGMVYLIDPATADEDRATVHRLFDGAEGVASVIEPAEFPRYHLPKPEDHPGMADMIIAAKEGYAVGGTTNGETLVAEHKQTGSHGYLSTEPKMNALFVASARGSSTGPSCPASRTSTSPPPPPTCWESSSKTPPVASSTSSSTKAAEQYAGRGRTHAAPAGDRPARAKSVGSFQAVCAVGDRASGSEGGGDHGGLGEFGLGAAGGLGLLRVNLDAVGALGGQGHGDGHQLLRSGGDRPVRHHRLVERHEAFPRGGGQLAELLELLDVVHVVHRGFSECVEIGANGKPSA